jgi:hypothetical protein
LVHHVIGISSFLFIKKVNFNLNTCSPTSPQYSPQSPASSTISSSISSPRTHDDDDLNDNGDLME